MSGGPRVLLMQLSERTSAKGNRYMSGWLGKASVVAFPGELDKHGNATWDVFVSTPEPRPEQQQSKPEAGQERDPARRPGAKSTTVGDTDRDAPAKPSARPVERGSGWRGPSAYRRPDGAVRAPAGDGGAFHEDDLADIGR